MVKKVLISQLNYVQIHSLYMYVHIYDAASLYDTLCLQQLAK